jgi:outer membrane PBP1 activator LpoA protein
VAPETPSAAADRQVDQAEALSRKGDHKGAARAYETLATQSPGDLRDRFLLRASREYVRADDTAQATALLNQVSTSLPRADFGLRSLVTAELALRGGRGDKALAELDSIPQPIPSELSSAKKTSARISA